MRGLCNICIKRDGCGFYDKATKLSENFEKFYKENEALLTGTPLTFTERPFRCDLCAISICQTMSALRK